MIKSPSPGALQGCGQKLRTYHAQDVLVRVLGQLQYHLDKHFGLVVGSSTSCSIRVYIHEQVCIRVKCWHSGRRACKGTGRQTQRKIEGAETEAS